MCCVLLSSVEFVGAYASLASFFEWPASGAIVPWFLAGTVVIVIGFIIVAKRRRGARAGDAIMESGTAKPSVAASVPAGSTTPPQTTPVSAGVPGRPRTARPTAGPPAPVPAATGPGVAKVEGGSGAIIGIDLGTTNSLVAVFDDTGRARVVYNRDGDNLTPSAVYFENESTMVAGKEAYKLRGTNDPRVVTQFKRDMVTKKTYDVLGKSFSPSQLSAVILKRIAEDVEHEYGKVTSCVVTIPANFTHEAREATVSAAVAAGLPNPTLVNEPTAAALYYAVNSPSKLWGNYIIYDFGGGTFDCTIVKVQGTDIEVVASEGVAKLGGADIDLALQTLVIEKATSSHNCEDVVVDLLDCEDKKKSLSSRTTVRFMLVSPSRGGLAIEVTREELNQAIERFNQAAMFAVQAALDVAKLSAKDIRDVFMAGGSSRIPLFQEAMARLFGKRPVIRVNPDEAIALGAALYAGLKTQKQQLTPVQQDAITKLVVQERAPYNYGVVFAQLNQQTGEYEHKNRTLIRKGEKIPCEVADPFYTIEDGQTRVRCQLTCSAQEETDLRFVKIVKTADLQLPAGRPCNQEIMITYAIDEAGRMRCSFKDSATGKITTLDLSYKELSGVADTKVGAVQIH